MKTVRLTVLGIPPHTILNDMPRVLLPTATLCDLLYLFGRDRSWATTSYHLLRLGTMAALPAGLTGALDFLRLPQCPEEVQRIGRTHAILNGALLPMLLLNRSLRADRPERPSFWAILLLLLANVGLGYSAWLGSRLVHQFGVRTGEQGSATGFGARVEDASLGAGAGGREAAAGLGP